MSSVEIEIVGYIAKEPETRYSTDGKECLTFSVPHDNYKNETEWYNCALYGEKRVKSLGWLAKGMGVFIRGTLNITEKDGKIYRNVMVDKLQVIGGKKQEAVDDEELPF